MSAVEPRIPVALTNVLMQAVVDHLTERMISTVADDAKAGLIRAGNLQDDPTDARINLLIHPGGEDWPHILNTSDEGQGFYAPTYEIGSPYGAMFLRRRFVIELRLFFPKEKSRERAQKMANAVLHRAVHALWTMQMPQGKDDFGESAHAIQVRDHFIEEGGGTGTFIWTGKIKIEFMTHLSPV